MSETIYQREPDTERRILEAAGRVFMLKGKLGASMQDIADEAGINRTLLHYYFRNKEKLFNTVFDKTIKQAFPAMVGIMASKKSLPERIRLFIESYTKLLRENPYLPVFVFQEISLNPERITSMIQDMGIDPATTLKGFKEDIERLGLRDVDPRQLFASMMGMVLFPYIGRGLFQAIAFQGDAEAYDRFLEDRNEHIPAFMEMAFRGAAELNKES